MITNKLPNGLPTVDAWITALRSGEYQQGDGFLRSPDNKFCCLGVFCNLIDSNAWTPEFQNSGRYRTNDVQVAYTYGAYGDQMIEGDLSKLCAESIGLTEGVQNALADMNDTGREFGFIAEFIDHYTNGEGKINSAQLQFGWGEVKSQGTNP